MLSFSKIKSYLALQRAIKLIKSSGLFVREWYLANNPDIVQAKVDPLLHFLRYGGQEGRDPGPAFSSAWYLGQYTDVRTAGMNPLLHFLISGREEGRLRQPAHADQVLDQVISPHEFDAQWYLNVYPDVARAGVEPFQHYILAGKSEGRLGRPPTFDIKKGGVKLEPARDTVLVVSHEASRSGAPILSLNLIQNLQKKYNVVSIIIDGGTIENNFCEDSTFVVGPITPGWTPAIAGFVIDQLVEIHQFRFAIVNSIASCAILPALARRFIPTVSLIHEFSAYIRPRSIFLEVILWANEIVFSAGLTHENAISEYPELEAHHCHVIPQGRCVLPLADKDSISQENEAARILSVLRPKNLSKDALLVIGVGSVNLRKGVDLFIDCAAKIIQLSLNLNIRFVWIGKGYNPEQDLGYSVYLADQIHRMGLQKNIFFLEETSNIEAAYKAADILLISSRLDPLPNVGIDAMAHGLPLVCFKNATGIADILISNNLEDECVAPYLDTARMAEKVLAFARSKSFSLLVGEKLEQAALREFDMNDYVDRLDQISHDARDNILQEQADFSEIVRSCLVRMDYFVPPSMTLSPEEAIRYYVRAWASGIRRRKLFPGFHPGIFAEQHGVNRPGEDPLAAYLREGQPSGPWLHQIITPDEIALPLPSSVRIALHIHVYYSDLVPGIMAQLNGNHVRPDLFISVPSQTVYDVVSGELHNYQGLVAEIKVTPNRGRDIGPFLSAFGQTFVGDYDIVGHLHTKKTVEVQDAAVGMTWHSFIMENMLGGKNKMADIILGRMAADSSIGMVFPDEPHIVGWEKNLPKAESIADQLDLGALPLYFSFPVGTMFWTRVDAILPIINLELTWDDYPDEPLPYDGTILHALERIFPLTATKRGYTNMLTNVRGVTR